MGPYIRASGIDVLSLTLSACGEPALVLPE